jgi:hypothetical protein
MTAEGWYKDPFKLHEARWFSDGRPTALVKDGSEESNDPPPDTAITDDLERAYQGHAAANGVDMRRADSQDSYDPTAGRRAAEQVMIRVPPFMP